MGTSNSELAIKLILENKEAIAQLQKSVGELQTKSKSAADSANLSWTALASKFYIAQQALQPLIGFMSDAIRASMENEDAVNRLNVSLQNQGYFTEQLSQQYQNMAQSLQQSTRYSDESIMQVQQTLVTFGNVAPSQMERVTKAVLDFATAKRVDAVTAANLFAKAAAGNTSALSRYGIVIDETIPKHERFNALLGITEGKMGGAAAADMNTYAGSVAHLHNMWDELLESFGGLITQNPAVIGALNGIAEACKNLAKAFKEAKNDTIDFYEYLNTFRWGGGIGGASMLGGAQLLDPIMGNLDKAGSFAQMGERLGKTLKDAFSWDELSVMMGGPAGAGGVGASVLEKMFGGAEAQAAVIETAQQTADQVRMIADQEALYEEDKNNKAIEARLGLERTEIDSVLKSTQFIQELKQKQQLKEMKDQLEVLKLKKGASDAELNLKVALEQAVAKVEQQALLARFKGQMAFASATANAMTALAQLTGNSTIASVAMTIQVVVQAIQTILTAIATARAAAWDWAGAAAIMGAVAALMGSAVSVIASLRGAKQNLGAELSSSMESFSGSLPDLGKAMQIPGAASGANVLSPGWLMVGERGPELLNVPRGATVSPLGNVSAPVINIYVNITLNNPIVGSEEIARSLGIDIGRAASEYIAIELDRLH